MRLPDFLIIGAMKSGTTGLFLDLCRHPQIFLPSNKEPHSLRDDKVLTPEGQQEYASYYAQAREDQLICDASTGYSKLPDFPGVPERAVKVLSPHFRVIYIVRDPIDRIVSQHYHEFIQGRVPQSIDQAVREDPRFINYSRYAYQIAPWIQAVGNSRVKIVRFEDYVASRQETIAGLCEFLGLSTDLLPPVDTTVHNRADGKPVMNGLWQRVQASGLYQRGIRPLLSLRVRATLQKWLLPAAPGRPAELGEETREWLRGELEDEVQLFTRLAGHSNPLWCGYEGSIEAISEA